MFLLGQTWWNCTIAILSSKSSTKFNWPKKFETNNIIILEKKLTFVWVTNPRVQYIFYYSMLFRAEILGSTNPFPCYPTENDRMNPSFCHRWQEYLICTQGKYCSILEETVLVVLLDNLYLNDGKAHASLFIISLWYGGPSHHVGMLGGKSSYQGICFRFVSDFGSDSKGFLLKTNCHQCRICHVESLKINHTSQAFQSKWKILGEITRGLEVHCHSSVFLHK